MALLIWSSVPSASEHKAFASADYLNEPQLDFSEDCLPYVEATPS